MDLYFQTLQPPTAVTHLALGKFLSTANQEAAVIKGSNRLSLLTSSPGRGFEFTFDTPLFSQVRQAAAIKPPGFTHDLLFLTSDSGKLTVIEFTPTGPRPLLNHTISKSGLRRATPGAFMAKDV